MEISDDKMPEGNVELSIEDDSIHSSFAGILKNFRLDFGSCDIRSIALGFKLITYRKLINLYESDPSQESLITNWILECKFWTILEALLDVKFNKEMTPASGSLSLEDVCEYSSETVIADDLIASDSELLQMATSLKSLSETFKLDFPTQNENSELENSFQTTKWLNTFNKLNSMNKNPDLVKALDMDSTLRTSLTIDAADSEKDELFFRRAFKLLLANEIEDLKSLCELTNNWDFALMIAGLSNRIDPIIDLSDYSNNTIPSGIKSKMLSKRTIYQLASNENVSPYEKACYGILSSDFISCNEMSNNWEEKLYLYLNNLFNYRLENKILKVFKDLGLESELHLLTKLSRPPLMTNSIGDILNKLSNDRNSKIKQESKNSIRVLIGSIISDNVKVLMENTIKSLDELLLTNDNVESELTNQSYLLRILTHLSIILQLIYGEEIITNDVYTKLLRCYILRLILYKSYQLVPIYISFIPNQNDIVDIYSTLLFQFDYSINDRISQINGMRNLNLPLEPILRKTIEKAFDETSEYYPTNKEIQLNYEVDLIDEKLYSTIYWFIDSNMNFDSLEAIIILMRRFLLVGKIGSAIKFLTSISLPKLIDNYKIETSVLSNINDKTIIENLIPDYKIHELTNYHNLFSTFKLLLEYNNKNEEEVSFEELAAIIQLLNKLVRDFLFDLIDDSNESLEEADIEIYRELRRIYIPTLFNALFDLLIENKNKSEKYVENAMELVNLLADEQFKLYEILNSTDELKPFLTKLANVGSLLYGVYKEGVYI